MAYSRYSKILASDYNDFVARLNKVWGTGIQTGTGSYGYGQGELLTVDEADDITASHWSRLNNTVNKAGNHQGDSKDDSAWTTITSPVTGDDISVLNGLSNNIMLIDDYRLSIDNPTGSIINPSDRITIGNNVSSSNREEHRFSVSFDEARYFFNAGGFLRFTFVGYPDETASSSNSSGLSNFLSSIPPIDIYANYSDISQSDIDDAGLTLVIEDRKGFNSIPSSIEDTIFFLAPPGLSNYFFFEVRKESLSSIYIEVTIRWSSWSSHTITLSYMTHVAPMIDTTHLSNSWGTPVTKDPSKIILSPIQTTVNEGSTADVDVRLTEPPSSDITVTASESSSKISISPSSRTFTSSNWDTEQSFTITGTQDSDDFDDTATFTLTASDDSSDVVTGVVSIIDDDFPKIDLSSSNTYTIAEGASTTLSVKLTKQPSEDVNILVNNTSYYNVTISPGYRTFTSSNWNTYQSFTVTGLSIDDGRDRVDFIHLVTDNDKVDTEDILYTVEASDPADSFIIVDSSITISEGKSKAVTVRLREQPSSSVSVAVSENSSSISVSGYISGLPLIWSASGWYYVRRFELTALSDSNAANETATVTLTASGGSTDTATITVSVIDDETANPNIVVSTYYFSIPYNGSGSFSVKLSEAPESDVTISTLIGYGASISPTSRTFTSSNWNTYQSFTVNNTHHHWQDGGTTVLLIASGGSDDTESISISLSGDPTGGP